MATSSSLPWSRRQTRQRAAAALAALAVAVLSACDLPFTLPATRALESGAADTLSAAKSLEISGSYTEGPDTWSIDLQISRPDAEHAVVTGATEKLEAIVLGNTAYFRGQEFLSRHMGSDALSQNLVKATGSAWWKGTTSYVPRLTDLTDGASFRATFLGTVITQRSDHGSVDGLEAVELSGPRADVFIAATPPYRVLRVHMKKGVVVDGIGEGDLRFHNFDKDFQITAPTDVIDFSNLSTLPPIYTVVSVDTSGCVSQCVVSALLKNLGGMTGAKAPTTVTFTMTEAAAGKVVGSCRTQVIPDVGYNATTTVECTIKVNGQLENAAVVTATPDNPGHA